jgi:DNA repair protein RecO (recombination protein O)
MGRNEAWGISKDVLRYLRHFQRSKWQQVENVVIPEVIETGMNALIERYFSYLLERKLNSPEFLRDVQQKGHDQEAS